MSLKPRASRFETSERRKQGIILVGLSQRDFVLPQRVQQRSLLGTGAYGVVYEGQLNVDGLNEKVIAEGVHGINAQTGS